MLKFLAHAACIVLLCAAFSFAMFLGLQVRPAYGDIGLAVTAALAATYVYCGFFRR